MFQMGVIGLMSGTSLDGLDICFARFQFDKTWRFDQLITKTVPYNLSWRKILDQAIQLSPDKLAELDEKFGDFLAIQTEAFLKEHDLSDRVELIASHGHTVHHRPSEGVTVQIGNGQRIANHLNKSVVYDFRINDVKLGGQGAPLVPVGDELLFHSYDACLNLGGIANISYRKHEQRIAFDISPCNLPLNKIMRDKFEKEFDQDGHTAMSGKVIPKLLDTLNQLDYYRLPPPKSLGVEWLNAVFNPIIDVYQRAKTEDVLATIIAHETDQIAQVFEDTGLKNVLITGGGAFNSYFIEQLKVKTTTQIILPEEELISFKEALIFGFLGVLNVRNEINTYRSVTGAKRDSIGGKLVAPQY
jgi:anhydro-N-acetylmuramic acid kinase